MCLFNIKLPILHGRLRNVCLFVYVLNSTLRDLIRPIWSHSIAHPPLEPICIPDKVHIVGPGREFRIGFPLSSSFWIHTQLHTMHLRCTCKLDTHIHTGI